MPKSPISAPSDPVLSSLTARVQAVSDIYADAFGIERDEGWHLAKLQEELGELMAAHLKATGRGRTRRSDAEAKADTDEDILRRNVEDETADLFAQVLLFAAWRGVDLPKALERKWFSYLSKTPGAGGDAGGEAAGE